MTARSNSSLPGLLVVLALIGGALWFATRSAPPPVHSPHELARGLDVPASRATEPVELAHDAERHPIAESQPSSPAPPTPQGPAVLRGTVRRASDQTPIADLEVEIRAEGGNAIASEVLVTDARGEFHREWTSSFALQLVTVRAGPETGSAQRWVRQTIDAAHPLTLEFEVEAGGRVAGRVIDSDGNPIGGAEVLGWCGESFAPAARPDRVGSTDTNGAFQLEHLGPSFTLSARKDGLACVRGLRGKLAAGSSASGLEVVMSPIGWVRGIVVDEDSRPVAQCTLTIDAQSSSSSNDVTLVPGVERFHPVLLSTRSRPDGRFELGPLPARPWSVRVASEGLVSRDAVGDTEHELRIVLERGSVLRGRVIAPDGTPAAGAKVTSGSPNTNRREAITDVNGRFEFPTFAPTKQGFVVVEWKGAAMFGRDAIAIGPDDVELLEIQLELPERLAGVVVDANGTPIAGARVHIEGDRVLETGTRYIEPLTIEFFLHENEVSSDAAGRFEFRGLYRGSYEVRAWRPDEAALQARVRTRATDDALVLRIDPTKLQRVVFSGRIVDARTKEPVERATITPMLRRGLEASGRAVPCNDASGAFRLPGYDAGEYDLVVTSEGYTNWHSGSRALEEGEHTYDVELWPARSLQVSVLWRGARPANQSVEVDFTDPLGKPVFVALGAGNSIGSVAVRETPTYVTGLPATLVHARARAHAPGVSAQPIDVDLTREEVPSIVFELDYKQPEAERPRSFHFLPAWVADAADLDVTLEHIGQLSHDGKAGFLQEAVELSFLDTQGREIAHGSMGAVANGKRKLSFRAERQKSESEGSANSMLSIDLAKPPASIRATCAGCIERVFPFRASDEEDAVVVVALLRAR